MIKLTPDGLCNLKKTNRHRQMSTCHECANLRIIYLHIRNKFWKDTFNAHKEKNV